MSVREIVTVGDPVLRERARELSAEELGSAEVQQLIDDLIETKRAANGAGLAANQIGETLRVAVVEVEPGKPALPLQAAGSAHGDRQPGDRAARRRAVEIVECLPVGARPARGSVPRWEAVRVRVSDRDGEPHDGGAARAGPPARFQHEVDHLGRLCVPRTRHDPHDLRHLEHAKARSDASRREIVDRLGE
jgi:peptide deformylase